MIKVLEIAFMTVDQSSSSFLFDSLILYSMKTGSYERVIKKLFEQKSFPTFLQTVFIYFPNVILGKM